MANVMFATKPMPLFIGRYSSSQVALRGCDVGRRGCDVGRRGCDRDAMGCDAYVGYCVLRLM